MVHCHSLFTAVIAIKPVKVIAHTQAAEMRKVNLVISSVVLIIIIELRVRIIAGSVFGFKFSFFNYFAFLFRVSFTSAWFTGLTAKPF